MIIMLIDQQRIFEGPRNLTKPLHCFLVNHYFETFNFKILIVIRESKQRQKRDIRNKFCILKESKSK